MYPLKANKLKLITKKKDDTEIFRIGFIKFMREKENEKQLSYKLFCL